MNVQCAWCQKEIAIPDESPFQESPEAHYICTDCLIPMLPKTLLATSPADTPDATDKRQSQRMPLISQIYLTSQTKQKQITQALITDISESGMKLKIEPPLERGERITLGFLGRDLIYKAIGEVVRSQAAPDKNTPLLEVGIRLKGIHQDLR